MVSLDENAIDAIKKVKDALKETPYDINHFEVGDTGAGGSYIRIDIRLHEDKNEVKSTGLQAD